MDNSMDRRGWWCYSPWGHKELDVTEYIHTHTHTHINQVLETLISMSLPPIL